MLDFLLCYWFRLSTPYSLMLMHYADSCNALILSFYHTDDEFFSTQPAGCD